MTAATVAPPSDTVPARDASPEAGAAGRARIRSDFLCRVSGLPATTFSHLRLEKSVDLVNEIFALEEELAACKDPLVETLHVAVGNEPDKLRRRRLLHLKRNAFNSRPLDDSGLADLGLAPEGAELVERYRAATERREQLIAQLRRTFQEELAQVRARFKTLLGDPDFQAGLLLSSRSLFMALADYLAGDNAAPTAGEEHVERGLLRYLSRMAMKATPFGTFCAVIAGRFVVANGGERVAHFVGDPRRKRSFVRLNKRLYGFVMEHLKGRPAIRHCLPLELNPTLQDDGPRLLFLTAIEGREIFQRLDRNAVLDVVAHVVANRAGASMRDVIEVLAADERIDAARENIEAYVDRLVSLGFLRFRTGIREQDPDWDLPLKVLLESIEDEHARLVAALLGDLRAALGRYATAAVSERSRLLDHVRARITETLEVMQVRASMGRQPPVYEDASADARMDLFLGAGCSAALRNLAEFTTLTLRAAWPRGEQATMRHFFDSYYGANVHGVPLLKFYEEFYREHFKSHLEHERRGPRRRARDENEDGEKAEYNLANPFGLDLIRSIHASQARVRDLIERRCREGPVAEEISIEPAELDQALDLPPRAAPCRSLSLFAQLVPGADGGARVILPDGRYLAGYGKYFSRFLYTLPEGVSRRAYEGNLGLTDGYLAEICGDAAFNVNLHPPLLRWEISYPTGEAGHLQSQLSSAELEVRRDPADPNALRLYHRPTGTPVIPVDLGFLNARMRPPLYQLLAQFGPPVNFWVSLPPMRPVAELGLAEPANGSSRGTHGHDAAPPHQAPPLTGAPEVRYRPRIVFGEGLVLTRRTWSVAETGFLRWAPGTELVEFFLVVNRWRRRHGIPEQVYVRIHPWPAPQKNLPLEARSLDAGAKSAAEPRTPEPAVTTEVGKPAAPEARAVASPPQREREASGGGWTVPSRDFVKPQFIDFANPLLVGLFGRIPGALARFEVVIEECLPAAEALPCDRGDAFATELILQIDYPEDDRAGSSAPSWKGDDGV